MYTREMEERHAETEAALHKAVEAHKELDNARQRRLNQLGDLVLRAPQQSGTMGAGKWAIGHADKLTELLAPFTSTGEVDASTGEVDAMKSQVLTLQARVKELAEALTQQLAWEHKAGNLDSQSHRYRQMHAVLYKE